MAPLLEDCLCTRQVACSIRFDARSDALFQEEFIMFHLRSGTHVVASGAMRARDSTSRLPIVALGLAFSLSVPALTEAQTSADVRQARPTLSRDNTMTTQLQTRDRAAAA